MADAPQTKLPKKHRATLDAIFATPTRGDVKWASVVSLVKRLGGSVNEKRSGSRVAFLLAGRVFVIHKPHPAPTLSKGAVEDLRGFLRDRKVTPDRYS